jgi:hypothetical protein
VKAHQLIAGASYGPETLKVIGQTFDGAWAEIAHQFHSPLEIEAARLRLANAILAVAEQDSRDPEELKNLALQAMTLTYRRLRSASQPVSTETPPNRA